MMIPVPTGVRVWLATGHTDMRKGFPSLALQVQEILRRDPLSGHLFCFRGRRGDLLKVIWPTARARACSRSVWSGAGSYGRVRPTAWWLSRRHNSAICYQALIGATRRRRGDRHRWDDVFVFAAGGGCDSVAA
jgi:transposase